MRMRASFPSRTATLLALVLAAHAGLLARGAIQHTPSYDEAGHLPAGLSHWQFGSFELYRVNPPLVRMVAALPVLLAGPKTDWSGYTNRLDHRSEPRIGRAFLRRNGMESFWYFTMARWACIPFSLLGAWACFSWGRDLYGPRSGLLAATLWCFSPMVLAFGQTIVPDVAAAAFGMLAGHAFWRWLKTPSWTRASLAGAALGLAEITKTLWLLLFVLWPLLWIVYRCSRRGAAETPSRSAQAMQLLWALGIGVFIVNLAYAGVGSFQPLGEYRFISNALGGNQAMYNEPPYGNRFTGTVLAALPVPFPRDYVQGIDIQKRDFERKGMSYLFGEWRMGGWWYYYLYALLVKVPVGTWMIVLAALLAAFLPRGRPAPWRDQMTLVAPGIAVIALVSSQTGFNHHSRYVLPALPFVLVWAGSVVAPGPWRSPLMRTWITGALIWSLASSLWIWPHSLSYFNELAGGPTKGHAYLGSSPSDSNFDCGQDLLNLKRWLDRHPEAEPLHIALSGAVEPHILGIRGKAPPAGPNSDLGRSLPPSAAGPHPGWFAVSVGQIRVFDREIDYFLEFDPLATAGYSIHIYHVSPEEANRVRRNLGLPELPFPISALEMREGA